MNSERLNIWRHNFGKNFAGSYFMKLSGVILLFFISTILVKGQVVDSSLAENRIEERLEYNVRFDTISVNRTKSTHLSNGKSKYALKIIEVLEDSRCPESKGGKTYNCVWAGNAKIQLGLFYDGELKQKFTLNTYDRFENEVTVENHAFKLESLSRRYKAIISVKIIEPEVELVLGNGRSISNDSTSTKVPTRESKTVGKNLWTGYFGGNYKLRLMKVAGDSRCPQNAQCKWAGNAEMHFALKSDEKIVHKFILNSNDRMETEVKYKDMLIRLDTVSPEKGNKPILNYKAQVTMTKL